MEIALLGAIVAMIAAAVIRLLCDKLDL